METITLEDFEGFIKDTRLRIQQLQDQVGRGHSEENRLIRARNKMEYELRSARQDLSAANQAREKAERERDELAAALRTKGESDAPKN